MRPFTPYRHEKAEHIIFFPWGHLGWAARATVHPAAITLDGQTHPYGNIIDPAAIIEKLQSNDVVR